MVDEVLAFWHAQHARHAAGAEGMPQMMKRDAITAQALVAVDLGWMFPDCHDWKERLIGKPWGSRISTYLWYVLGDTRQLSLEDKRLIAAQLFVDEVAPLDGIGLHRSWNIPGGRSVLRIRGENILLLPRVSFRGYTYALYHIGHSDPSSTHQLVQPSINFHDCWNDK